MKKILVVMLMVVTSSLFSKNNSAFAYVTSEDDVSFSAQIQRAQNDSLSMSKRWDAIIKAAELADGQQMKQVLEFAKHKDWYMRNAVLVALDKVETDLVYDKAKQLVGDKALVVRSAAVDILNRLDNPEVRQILAAEVNKKYNFVGQKSLWIRSQILKNLVKKPYQSEKQFFAKLLFDKDPEVAALSMMALEKIARVRYEGEQKLDSWKKHVKKNQWL